MIWMTQTLPARDFSRQKFNTEFWCYTLQINYFYSKLNILLYKKKQINFSSVM